MKDCLKEGEEGREGERKGGKARRGEERRGQERRGEERKKRKTFDAGENLS